MKTEMIQESIHLPRFIKSNDKCIAMENGHRCKNTAEVEMVYYGDGRVSQIVARLCKTHAIKHDEDSYMDLDHNIYNKE